jgi:hypothetical protein
MARDVANEQGLPLCETVVPYQAPAPKGDNADISSTLSSTLPMAAIFTRNKFIGWASLVFSVQNWLGESEEITKSSTTPGYFTIGMSCKLPLAPFFFSHHLPPCSPYISAARRAICSTSLPANPITATGPLSLCHQDPS